MGGTIAELMAAQFSSRILSITLMGSSCDFRSAHRALDDLLPQQGSLYAPRESYIASVKKAANNPPRMSVK